MYRLTYHATEQVKGAAERRVVGQRQVTCSAVSGKSLARASETPPAAAEPAAGRGGLE
jgi:hypothetical protein